MSNFSQSEQTIQFHLALLQISLMVGNSLIFEHCNIIFLQIQDSKIHTKKKFKQPYRK